MSTHQDKSLEIFEAELERIADKYVEQVAHYPNDPESGMQAAITAAATKYADEREKAAYIAGRNTEVEVLGFTEDCDCITCAELKMKTKALRKGAPSE